MNRFFIFLSLYYFLFFTLIGDYVIFLPKYFKSIGFSASEIGLIFAIMPIARFLTPFIFLKKPLTQRDYIFSLIISVIASFLLLSNNFYLILISFFIIGASFAVIFPYIEAIAIEKLKEKYGKARVFGSLGFMLFGIILSYISGNLIYLFIILIILTNLIAFYFNEKKIIKKDFAPLNFKKEWKFWIGLILLQISFGGFYNFFTIYLLNHHIKKEYIGWLWSIGVIAEIAIFLIGHRFLKKLDSLIWIKISILLTSVRWLILYLFPSLIFIVLSQLIHAFSFAIFHTSALLYISKKYENKTLAQQFYAGIGYGLAAFLGSIVSGMLYGENLFLYESLIAFAGFLIML